MQRPTPPANPMRVAHAAAGDPYLVSPVAKALAVLAFVEDAGTEVGLSDVARALGLPKTSAFRYLYTLAAAGFVAYGTGRDRYRAGLGSIAAARARPTSRGCASSRCR
jgi:IclR family transcriptional regulator, KDG regulon repressor